MNLRFLNLRFTPPFSIKFLKEYLQIYFKERYGFKDGFCKDLQTVHIKKQVIQLELQLEVLKSV